MIPVSRLAVFAIVACLALVGIPMALGGSPAFQDVGAALPITLAAEFIVYFASCFILNSRMTIPSIAFLSFGMVVVRAATSVLSVIAHDLLINQRSAPGVLDAWVGNPVSVLLQAVTMMIVAPHVLNAASADPAVAAASKDQRSSVDAAPAGGFVQVFSFDDLAGVIRKTPGLEGFVLCSSEGLVVWKELPAKLAGEDLVARLLGSAAQVGRLSEANGLARVRKTLVQTREHILCVADLNPNFGMILIYSGRTKLADCDARIEILARTAREFLQWKYPGLTMSSSSLSQTAVPLVS